MPASTSEIEDAMRLGGRFFTTVKSLAEFDIQRLRPILQGQLNLTDREKGFFGLYLRVCALIRSLLRLDDTRDFQATISLSRSILELGIDLKLLTMTLVPDAAEKILTFHEVERLRSATELVELKARRADLTSLDVSIQQQWITYNKGRVEAEHDRLWGRDRKGNLKRIRHWSGFDLAQRARSVGGEFEHWHGALYTLCNWHVHSGLAGFLNVDAEAFALSQGMAFRWVANCYQEILKIMVREFGMEKGDADVLKHIKLAFYLPWIPLRRRSNCKLRFLVDLCGR